MKRIYARELVFVIIGGFTLFYVSIIMAWQTAWSLYWMVLSMSIALIVLVRVFLFVYQMWATIQDSHARMTPKRAVLFSFIPVFSIYWMYQCVWGFAHDCNAYIKRHAVSAKPLPTIDFFLSITFCFLSFIPYVAIVTIPLATVVITVSLVSTVRALNAIIHAKAHAHS